MNDNNSERFRRLVGKANVTHRDKPPIEEGDLVYYYYHRTSLENSEILNTNRHQMQPRSTTFVPEKWTPCVYKALMGHREGEHVEFTCPVEITSKQLSSLGGMNQPYNRIQAEAEQRLRAAKDTHYSFDIVRFFASMNWPRAGIKFSRDEATESVSNQQREERVAFLRAHNDDYATSSNKKEDEFGFLTRGSGISKKDEAAEKRMEQEKKLEAVRQQRELNPNIASSSSKPPTTSSSGGYSSDWLIKSYKSLMQLAKDENRNVGEVISERYGSVEELEKMIAEARRKERSIGRESDSSRRGVSFRRPGDEREEGRVRDKGRQWERRDRDTGEARWRKKRSRSRSPKRDERKRERSRSRERKRRPPSPAEPSQIHQDDLFVVDKKPNPVTKEVIKVDAELGKLNKNQLAARLIKAEMMGNKELVEKIKAAQKSIEDGSSSDDKSKGQQKQDVLLTVSSRTGFTRPVEFNASNLPNKRRIVTHDEKGGRDRYFYDDDEKELRQMVADERSASAANQNEMFLQFGPRDKVNDDDFSVDDMFVSKAANKKTAEKQQKRERADAMKYARDQEKELNTCVRCIERTKKHTIIASGLTCYIAAPEEAVLSEYQCQIIPNQHVVSSTLADEDVWEEILLFKQSLTKMFRSELDKDVLFTEMCRSSDASSHQMKHMVIDCYPVEEEGAEMAPMLFKKALQEAEGLWTQNRKCVPIKKNIRHTVPRGMNYFSVEFSPNEGFVNVIEDIAEFPESFGRELMNNIVGADDPLAWRRQKKKKTNQTVGVAFEKLCQNVMQLRKLYSNYNWLQKQSNTNIVE